MYTDEYTDYTPHSVADALSWAQSARNEYADEIVSKHEYYGSGLSGWKQAVLDYLPAKCSLAFRVKVEEFLDKFKTIE